MEDRFEGLKRYIERDVLSTNDYGCNKPATATKICTALYSKLLPFWNDYWPGLPHVAFSQANLHYTASVQVPTRPGFCGRNFKKGDAVYCCRDCSYEEIGAICHDCFNAADHEDHDVTFIIHNGSALACACSDPEAWKVPFCCSTHSSGPSSESVVQMEELPDELVAILSDSIAFSLHYCLEVLTQSPTTPKCPNSPQEIKSELNPLAGLDADAAKGPWTLVLWNDEKHSYEQVISQLCRAIRSYTHAKALASASIVDEYGRTIVLLSSNPVELHKAAEHIDAIDLATSVRSAYATYQENVCSLLIDWMALLATSANKQIRQLIADQLLQERSRNDVPYTAFGILLALDSRLWKRARLQLRHLYTSLLSIGGDSRIRMGAAFMKSYPELVSTYLFNDREPEYSILQFSSQLFVIPSVVQHLVHTMDTLFWILSILTAFFTKQFDLTAIRSIKLTETFDTATIDADSAAFKHKRYTYLFADLARLMGTTAAKKHFAESSDMVKIFTGFISLFHGMNANLRMIGQHVEYESETWVSAFNLSMHMSKACRSVGAAIAEDGSREQCREAIQIVLAKLVLINKANGVVVVPAHYGNASTLVWQTEISSSPISFHHPLSWFLAELLKSGPGSLIHAQIHDLQPACSAEELILAAVQEPLHVLALLSQIKAGLWVRNGFSIRAQQLHYRDSSLREYTYEQDIYLLQAAFALAEDPSAVLILTMSAFEMLEWFKTSRASHPLFDASQAYIIAEDLFSFLITVLSEPAVTAQWTAEMSIRRDIIHALALGSCSRSELSKRLSERLNDELHFDAVLGQVATFRKPQGALDHGIYYLRTDFYSQLDPYYFRYNRNQRDDCLKAIKEHLPQTDDAASHIVLPIKREIGNQHTSLTQIYACPVFTEMLAQVLNRICAETDQTSITASESDNVLDAICHLIMLALVYNPSAFCEQALQVGMHEGWPSSKPTLLSALLAARVCKATENLRPKILWCLHKMSENLGPRFPPLSFMQSPIPTSVPGSPVADTKKAAAKARQAAIMAQFASAQKSLLNEFENEDEATDEVGMDIEENKSSHIKSAGTCIVCQEGLNSLKVFGALALIQSSQLVKYMQTDASLPLHERSLDMTDRSLAPNFGGLHVSNCDHMMHLECFDTYCQSIEVRQLSHATRKHPEDLGRREFICPLCKSLGNILLPVTVEESVHAKRLPSTPESALKAIDLWAHNVKADFDADRWDLEIHPLLAKHGQTTFTALQISEDLPSASPFEQVILPMVKEDQLAMLERIQQVVWPLSIETHRGLGNARSLPAEVVAYTVMCLEISSRDSETDIGNSIGLSSVNGLSSLKHGLLIKGLLAVLQQLVQTAVGNPRATCLAAEALALRLDPDLRAPFSESYPLPMLYRETLPFLVEAAAVAPSGEFFIYATFSFYIEMIRTTLSVLSRGTHSRADGLDKVPFASSDFLSPFLVSLLQHPTMSDRLVQSGWHRHQRELVHLVYTFTLPWLRQAYILQEMSGLCAPTQMSSQQEQLPEYTRLLLCLGIPSPEQLCASPEESRFLVGRLHTYVTRYFDTCPQPHDIGVLLYPFAYQLISIPKSLGDLVDVVARTLCDNCHTVPADPALCLLCGTVVCHQLFCCSSQGFDEEDNLVEPVYGECNSHMWDCGGSSGVYLLVKKSAIVYLHATSGTYGTSPYLDVHGEVDMGHKRHKLQYLHRPRYEEIRQNWLKQSIATVVARKLEATTDPGGWGSL